jgi:hypothetical protein
MTILAGPFFAGRVYTADDLGAFHLPLRDFYARQLAAGEPFDWMPSLYCGFNVTGEGQLGAYHPLHLLLYRCLPLGAAFDWELLLSYPCLLAGTYLLLRRLVRQPDAALLGALTFTFSSFCLLHFVHPNAVAIVAHLPWLLWAIDLSVASQTRRQSVLGLAAVALLTGSQVLLGYPQYVWFSLLAEIAFAAWRLAALGSLPSPVSPSVIWLPAAAWLLAAKGCGLLIGAQQLLPTLDALRQSTRTAGDAAFANSGSLHPLNMLQLVAPYLFRTRVVGQNTHELGLYCGAVPLVLCVWLLVNQRSWRRYTPLITAALWLGGLALLIAFGEHGYLYSLQSYLPLVNRFRFPCRAIVLVQLAVAVLTAVAWIRLTRPPGGHVGECLRRPKPLLAVCAIAIAAALLGPLLWPQFTASRLLVWSGPALVCLAAWLVFAALHHRSWALAALPLLAAVDQGIYGFSDGAYRETADLNAFAAAAPLPPPAPHRRIVAAGPESPFRTGNRWLLAGFARADGYAGLEPKRRLDYHAEKVLRLAGVEFCSVAPAQWQLASAPAAMAQRWHRVERPLDRARLLTQVDVGPLTPDLAGLDVDHAAILDQPLKIPLGLPLGLPGKTQLPVDRPGHIEVRAIAPERQLLTLNEGFDLGWHAAVDGQPVPVLRVNGDFLGCLVPAGEHRVEWVFSPRSLMVGRLLSGCGLGLLGLFVCGSWGLNRRAAARG